MAKKSKLSKPSKNTVYTKSYTRFSGVDFSCEASMADDTHSPYAENIISDIGGYPEKRLGWRTLKTLEGKINGIFAYDNEGSESGGSLIIHAGTKIYSWTGREEDTPTELLSGVSDSRSAAKYFKGKLCILTGSEYLVYDGDVCVRADRYEEIYAPITMVSGSVMTLETGILKDAYNFQTWIKGGGMYDKDGSAVLSGTVPEETTLNLVSGKRRNTFTLKSGLALFKLDGLIDKDSTVVIKSILTGKELFRGVYSGGEDGRLFYSTYYADLPGAVDEMFDDIRVAENSRVDVVIGNCSLQKSGYIICYPNTAKIYEGIQPPTVDDIMVEFFSTVEGYPDRINKCTCIDVFENRVFFSGNPDYPNADWYSGVNDPMFIPDINYTEVGVSSSPIVGYLRTGDCQAILKADGDDATIYMRSYSSLSDGSVIFPIRQGTNGIGAIAGGAVCTFLDDPVYLTRNGVYAIALQDISSERALNVRSSRINKRLLKEENLKNAIMCEWNGYLLLCVNGNCYVADAGQKTYFGNKTGTFEYEWYYWTNIPATVMYEHGGILYFGTADGRLCRFNNDMKNERGELLSSAYSDDGEPICAVWATNLSDDGNFMQEKTLVKTGSGIFLKSYNRSGISVCVRTDADFGREVLKKDIGIFNFEDIDFGNFTFNTNPYAVIPLNSRVKKYSAIQIICRNNENNQAFGIGGIIRRYFYGKIKK